MFVERGQFLETLCGLLAEVTGGAGRLVFLGGEAGIGKTTLATALLASAPAEFVIRRGSCDNLTTAAALGPIVEALPELDAELAIDGPVDRLRIVQHIRAVLADAPTLVLLRYWVAEKHGKIFCLVDAPDAETANTVHRQAHGLVADEIFPVPEGA